MVISVEGTFRRLALTVDGSCPNLFCALRYSNYNPVFCKPPFERKDLTRHPQNCFPAPVRNQLHAPSLVQMVIRVELKSTCGGLVLKVVGVACPMSFFQVVQFQEYRSQYRFQPGTLSRQHNTCAPSEGIHARSTVMPSPGPRSCRASWSTLAPG